MDTRDERSRRRGLRVLAALPCAVLVATFTGFLGVVPASAEQVAPAAVSPVTGSGSAFDPGNIISDAVFYDTASMTQQRIDEFIRAQGAGCVGSLCLKNLRVTTPDQPPDPYCAAYQGGTNEDAATVLLKFSVACGVNPQVMLVTMQKESQLLTRTAVTESSYDAAWGWHCPDTRPGGTANCDPAYAGFFNQGYGMAKQWARYRVDPGRYNYRAGQTANILWNVAESGCGSSPVTIQNTATASLFNYTPYQPNAASLAAYPGVGDSCSSYGNRNFSFLFQKYFGSAGGSMTARPVAVSTVAPTVTIPNSDFVAPEVAGRTITAPDAAVAAGLTAGFAALGLPYVWGGGGSGAGPDNGCGRGGGDFNSCGGAVGFDCSGLTAFVLGQAGYRIPDNSGSQRSAGLRVDWAQALPGDVVGFPGHVAIYLGAFDGRPYILEASWVGTPIHIVPLTRTDVDGQLYRYWTGPAAGVPGSADFASIVKPAAWSPTDSPSTLSRTSSDRLTWSASVAGPDSATSDSAGTQRTSVPPPPAPIVPTDTTALTPRSQAAAPDAQAPPTVTAATEQPTPTPAPADTPEATSAASAPPNAPTAGLPPGAPADPEADQPGPTSSLPVNSEPAVTAQNPTVPAGPADPEPTTEPVIIDAGTDADPMADPASDPPPSIPNMVTLPIIESTPPTSGGDEPENDAATPSVRDIPRPDEEQATVAADRTATADGVATV